MKKTCILCDKPHKAKGYCVNHYKSLMITGDPEARVRKIRPIEVKDGVGYITAANGMTITVDEADVPAVSEFNWSTMHNGYTWYAVRSKNGKLVLMHRQLLSPAKGEQVDHLDHNGLNNTRANMRVCDQGSNNFNKALDSRNKTGFRGVYKVTNCDRYCASIKHNKKTINLGYFLTAEEAYLAYTTAAIEIYGDLARKVLRL